MNYYSDPTANAAIGAVDKEISRMRKRAARLRQLRRQGRLTPREEDLARKEFSGICRKLLQEELQKT